MTIPQTRKASESVIDNDTYCYISELANADPGEDPFATANTVDESTDTGNSCIKDCADIAEASPEPEDTSTDNPNGSTASHDYYFEKKLQRMKLRQKLLFALSTILAIMFIASLIGLIVVATSPKRSNSRQDLKNPDAIPDSSNAVPEKSLTKVTSHSYEFSHFNGMDPEIALAFADHSLYTSFYGVTYSGPGNSTASEGSSKLLSKEDQAALQHQIIVDVALLSRITPRIRISQHEGLLTDRVIQAINDLNINLDLALSLDASNWRTEAEYALRILSSYGNHHIKNIFIEMTEDHSMKDVLAAYNAVTEYLTRKNMQKDIDVKVITTQHAQANPLKVSSDHPKLATEWINSDHAYQVYTNLETPAETSEKAQYMTAWVCGVAPHIRSDIQWYWANAFDDSGMNVANGIFTQDRKLKPAGLPRCQDYRE